MPLSAPVHRLKHKAKLLSRQDAIPLHAALDQIAAEEGYPRWSLLAARKSEIDAGAVSTKLSAGDLVLVAARPGEGKTRFGLELAVRAMEAGRSASMFSLEDTPTKMIERLRRLGRSPQAFGSLFRFDDSNAICADHIVRALVDAPRGSLIVVDYLQLLDQRRENPLLADQIGQLRAFASLRGLILVFISQIDRSYDPAAKPFPSFEDVRLPNPLDLSLFDWGCFLQSGRMSVRSRHSPGA